MMDDAMTLSHTHTHTDSLSQTHTRWHDTPIDREMNEMAEWHFVLPCERSIKIFQGGGFVGFQQQIPTASFQFEGAL